ncbi:YafY family transcriptional regulator [Pedobacter polaris]|uniref:YafY family transcriptional regulator n=1 Tax=Pedobacter polaris TaxID=2571273 RepID=A0A4U1CSH4_9SPHI|nr:YafY family protein [Pedobacter polaris]TKC12061.1 YafY family transcriptional regulator [Pedobacter polaris]
MEGNDTKRISRLTAIITQLQSKRLITSTALAKKFNVSIRTIYRDIRALEQSGVPILTEEGKGYTLMEGYRIPPIMFTETEANALITAEQLVIKNKDTSFVQEYMKAIEKIKSVLRQNTKDNTELLSNRIAISEGYPSESTSNYLSSLQLALTNFNLTKIEYQKPDSTATSERIIEPFALLSTQGNWLLVAWCRLRNSFRLFRLDRIKKLEVQDEKFEPHPITLQEYFKLSQN